MVVVVSGSVVEVLVGMESVLSPGSGVIEGATTPGANTTAAE
jgi:hypothetical protein